MSSRALDSTRRPDARSFVAAWRSVRPEWAALLVVALVAAIRVHGRVDTDVAWQLWIAHQIHSGAHLYRDIIEINPPLWFWMALPIDKAASATGLRPEAVLVVAVAALQALSLLATSRLLRMPRGKKALLLAYAALIVGAFPWINVGQREQIVLIATLPYAALVATRGRGRPVTSWLALSIGIGAGLGFALKHYFLIVPALLEFSLIARQRRSWTAMRPELVGIALVGVIYVGAVLVWARDFLTTILPMIRLAYGSTGAPAAAQLFQPVILLALAAASLAAANLRLVRERQAAFGSSLLVAAAGFAIAYFIQGKGWNYHAIPFVGCSAIALAAMMSGLTAPPRLLRLAGPVLLAMPLLLTWQEVRTPTYPSADLEAAIAEIPPGTSVGFLATEPAVPWSVTLQHRFTYPSRYIGFWMLRAVVSNEHHTHPDPQVAQFGRQVVRETVIDFRCAPPDRIIVARPTPAEAARGDFDILAFFGRDPDFAALMRHYREVSRTTIDTYARTSSLQPPAPGLCRAAQG